MMAEADEVASLLQLNEYNFNKDRRGRAVIINQRNFNTKLTGQQDRDGTDVDAEALEGMFMRLGFDVTRYDNLNQLDMSITMKQVAGEDHSDSDCFACAILSHGEEGSVYATNGKVKIENLIRNFKGDVCPTLLEKPKIFFVQACRGRRYDWGTEIADGDEVDAAIDQDGPLIRKIPVEADFLFGYSVCPGYFSWRNNQDGSWFVQALTAVFEKCSESMSLMEMMTLVNQVVAYNFESCTDSEFTDHMKQVPCTVSTLTRNVFFKPKY